MGTSTASAAAEPAANLVILAGSLSSDPRPLDLASGDTLLRLEVTVRAGDGRADTVPVVRFDATATERALAAGADVVVVGRVRRRFFRAVGATVSRTEVVAQRIVPAGRRAQVARAVGRAVDGLPWDSDRP